MGTSIKIQLLVLAVFFSSYVNSKNEFSIPQKIGNQGLSDKPVVFKFDAEKANINLGSTQFVEDDRLISNQGVSLKSGVSSAIDGERAEADLVFKVKVPQAGRYVMTTYAFTDAEGAELMGKATSKYESLFIRIQIDDQRPTKRVVYVPWDAKKQISGKFEFSGNEQQLKIWLPRGVILDYVQLASYVPPVVPEIAKDYQPTILPPAGHPRLWVNKQSLSKVKSRLEVGENIKEWWNIKKTALIPYVFEFDLDEEMSYNSELERVAEKKAFYYLMTNDEEIGKEAVQLMIDYLSVVEFGNILDITRELGRAIYYGSLVYDWCYDLLTEEEKQSLYNSLMRLADDMEIGWPPFKQSVLTGHGNEMQVSRDLLALSIAIYDEDPTPYKYTSYRVLEELVPMRNWQYQSPRHNQGVNYGAYRSACDMHAAWLFYRMSGKPVFDDNIKGLPTHWLYMRLPDGQMLRDGDGFNAGKPGEFYYWSQAQTMLLYYTYNNDPILKAEFLRQGGLNNNPVMFLLLNDPELLPESSLESLPLTIDFGPILGSMVARTGWNMGMNSNDVVAEIKGGGYHFGNHQHSDAGSIQIYYRGFQVADLGLYGFYGPPYDFNFHKRSISHSMMLARDPEEKFGNTESNDGGTRFNQRHPNTPEIAKTDPWFSNGKVVSADFGPSKLRPFFSYFDVDLVGAYSSKIAAYNRRFCFLNLDRDDIPAAIILIDDMTTANPKFKKYWQINTHNLPETTNNGVILKNERMKLQGKTHVEMLIPTKSKRELEILSGTDANSSFEFKYEIPGRIAHLNHPEGNGHRIMISPKAANSQDQFLTVFQLTNGDTEPLPISHHETRVGYVVYLSDRVVSINKGNDLIGEKFSLKVPDGEYQVLLAGMKPGNWNIKSADEEVKLNANVMVGKNTIFFVAKKGEYTIAPGRLVDAKDLLTDQDFKPGKK